MHTKTMPQSTCQHGQHRRQNDAGRVVTAACATAKRPTDRKVDVVAKPFRQRDMPPSPELRECAGKIGSPKVG